jgi:protoporphyrinogen oxidase
MQKKYDVVVVGGGFTGLSAAYELSKEGLEVLVLESEESVGGLAGAFDVAGNRLDRFYHHWFTNDVEVMGLIEELGLSDQVEINPTNTSIYYANNFFKLSTPFDLLKFTPIPFIDRIRLGVLTIALRSIKNWMKLENKTAAEWLKQWGGETAYKVVWEPLLKGKFGPYYEQISAVWFWNKLKLRGSSRGSSGEERLAYFKGGFIRLAEALVKFIEDVDGRVVLGCSAISTSEEGGLWIVRTNRETFTCNCVIVTTALPIAAKIVENWAPPSYVESLNRIKYLANTCLVLELDRALSDTYWLNVNDPSFPFVGVIEHTNFESPVSYGGRHIVYLSKYLPHTDPLYFLDPHKYVEFALPFLQKMFPKLQKDWILGYHLWKARWAQPIVEKHYSKLIPKEASPKDGFYICSMAQIYPEDRGTNYAIREGRACGQRVAKLALSMHKNRNIT